jgi:hypothetical protein
VLVDESADQIGVADRLFEVREVAGPLEGDHLAGLHIVAIGIDRDGVRREVVGALDQQAGLVGEAIKRQFQINGKRWIFCPYSLRLY